jgi:hypothetical protein
MKIGENIAAEKVDPTSTKIDTLLKYLRSMLLRVINKMAKIDGKTATR